MADSDFSLLTHKWSTSRRLFDEQVQKLQSSVALTQADAVVIMNIPRHHAKKLTQASDWTKDYFLSKESRAITDTHTPQEPGRPAPTAITMVFSRHPPTSDQWFALDVDEGSGTAQSAEGFAHVVEICIGLNAWHPSRCPLSLLQEYQLTYDEVATITVVVATSITDDLKHTFSTESVGNSVILIAPKTSLVTQLREDCWSAHDCSGQVEANQSHWKFSFILGECASEED